MASPQTQTSFPPDPLNRSIEQAAAFLVSEQREDGSWCGDYGGPMFLLPMYVAANYIAKRELPLRRRKKIISYILSVQNPDGSIGLHVEAAGCMFTSALCYVALRILGVDAGDKDAARMLKWIRDNGTPLGSAGWGKMTLSMLNLYDYEGLHPFLPELWILPRSLPIHPSRLWCHCRQVYLPIAYLYGIKAKIPENDLLVQLRSELYEEPYHRIRFRDHRDTVCSSDRYVDFSAAMRAANRVMGAYEDHFSPWLRKRALESLFDHIRYEDKSTSYIRIGPVNAVLNTLVHVFRSPSGSEVQQSFQTLDGYLWETDRAVKMNGYNSTALWDTAFATQALLASPLAQTYNKAIRRAHEFIRENQIIEELEDREAYFRHACRGGWPFSNRPHGWPISDCTAEGLKCALALEPTMARPVPEQLLLDAVRIILSMQNPSGGWATYELKRGGDWLEKLNPSSAFSDIMVDYPYVECTSACIQALARAEERFPKHFGKKLRRAIRRGERFLRRQQRSDGSWEGSWAVCFTYGTWFGVWGLLAAGCDPSDRAIQLACNFLVEHQNPDGGWGEHFTSCVERRYVPHPQSQAVNTAWALLSLIRSGQARSDAVKRGIRFLIDRQLQNGDWPQESVVGVFNKTTLINYDNYRRYFTLWALSLFQSQMSL